MDKTPQISITGSFRWLFKTMDRRGAIAAAIATLFIAATGFLANQPALLLGEIVDTLSSTADTQNTDAAIWRLLMLIIASLVGVEIFTVVRKYLIERTSVAVQKSAFMSQVRQLFSVRVSAMNGMRAGGLAIHLDRCVEGLVKLLKLTFLELVPSLAYATVAIYFAFSAHVLAGFVMLGVVSLATVFTVWQILSQKGIRLELEKSKGKIGGIVAELMSALPYIRATGLASMETARLDAAAETLKTTEMRHHIFMMAFDAAKKLTENAGLILVILTGLYLFRTGDLQSGGILTLVLLYRNAALPLEKMHKVIDEGHEAIIRIGMLDEIRTQPHDPGLSGTVKPSTDKAIVLIQFTDYHLQIGTTDTASLRLNDLKINCDSVVGIAGESGSGKSTFIQAIMGLYPDAEGRLIFRGCNLLDVSKDWLSSQIAYNPQRPFIISGSLRENVLLTMDTDRRSVLTDTDLHEALESAGVAQEPLDRLHNLDLELSEGGRNLSDGQCQRIGLARIFLSDAPLIILDEATSALDTLTEEIVIRNLAAHAIGKTVLMIAHRLSTLSWSDRLLVFENGEILQDGTYDVLSSIPGKFNELRFLGNPRGGHAKSA